MNRMFYLHMEEEASSEHIYQSYNSTKLAIENKNIKNIHTYSLYSMSFDLLDYGFTDLFFITENEIIEIKINKYNNWCHKELRKSHNLHKLI